MNYKNKKLYINNDDVNFRTTPDTKTKEIRKLKKGEGVIVIEEPWFSVECGDQRGWVRGDYLTEQLPPTPVSPPSSPVPVEPAVPVTPTPASVPGPFPPIGPIGPKFQSNPVRPLVITQHFGEDPAFYTRFNMKGHNGIDCRTKFEDSPDGKHPIYAVTDGTVTEAITVDNGGYGKYVLLSHPDGSQTLYGHLDSLNVSLSQCAKGGEIIGISDNTGVSSGAHLHFGYRPKSFNRANGYKGYEDPEPFFV